MKTIYLILLVLCFPLISNAEDNRIQTYLDYESAYLDNNAREVSKWLPDDFELVQTLHIPDYGPDSIKASKRQLLANMRNTGPSKFPRSSAKNVSIENIDSDSFCATSSTTSKTKVSGRDYLEKEVRKACFKNIERHMIVTRHSIDVFFEPI